MRRYLPAGLVLCAGGLLSLAAFAVVQGWEQDQVRADFQASVEHLAYDVERSIAVNLAAVESIRDLYAASREVERHEFRAFVGRILSNRSSIHALEWVPRVPDSERAAFEQAARQEGYPDFQIAELAARGQVVPARPRADYFPVHYLEPFRDNELALGYDVGSDATRREALERARDTGAPVVTGRIALALEPGEPYGVLVFVPVYRNDAPHDTLETRRANLQGFALGVFRIDDLVDPVRRALGPASVAMRLEDRAAPTSERLLFWHGPAGPRGGVPSFAEERELFPELRWSRTFEVAGRQWSLRFHPTADYLTDRRVWGSWAVLVGGMLFTVLLGSYLVLLGRHSAYIEHLARQNAELYEAARARAREVEALLEATREIASSLDLTATLNHILDHIVRLCAVDGAAVALLDANGTTLRIEAARGVQAHLLKGISVRLGEGLTGQVALTGEVINVPETDRDPRWVQTTYDTVVGNRSALFVPLRGKDRVIGVIGASSRQSAYFTPARERLLAGLADQAALAIERGRDITERKRLEDQLRQAQKMESIGRLSGGIAHDFNNLLTVINGFSELLLARQVPAETARGYLEEIWKAGERAATLTRQLLAFSRQQVLAPKELDLNVVVADTQKMLRRLIGEDIDLVAVLAPELGRVRADPGQLEQVLMNLVVNARDAMPRGGTLTIKTANVELDEGQARAHLDVHPGRYVLLVASDTGVGMDAKTLSRLFEPFFTTKEPGKGTGLGLSTVYGIVKQSGGHLEVESAPAHGATFKIYLPWAEEERPASEVSDPRASQARGSETVLVVEDEEPIRSLVRGVLQASGYTVLAAGDGKDALQTAEQHAGPIHLLVTDLVMPGLSGREVAKRLADRRPETKVLYMSGYTDDTVVRHGVEETSAAFLQKPFTPDVLARKVRQMLDGPSDPQD